MSRHFAFIAIIVLTLLPSITRSQDDNSLTKDEIALVKTKLINTFDALGRPPAGYAVVKENYDLPTQSSKAPGSVYFRPMSATGERTYGSQKKGAQAQEELQKEYQKKMAEAQEKEDYATIARLAKERQEKLSEMRSGETEGRKAPISVSVRFNFNPGAAIDPDAVLFQSPGVIALKSESEGSVSTGRVSVYCDPVNLREARRLTRVNLRQPERGVAKKTAVYNVIIELSGPAADIQAWAKKIEMPKVLGQIDTGK